ncbi:hypothetical protein BD770DRAFT_143942 [Pilaira anomala]|nr:hypothetical protein BD770DRAFT_143942 [Pilaira anomala]
MGKLGKLKADYSHFRKVLAENDLTIDRQTWQPMVVLENRFDVNFISDMKHLYKSFSYIPLNFAIECYTCRNYLEDPRYKEHLFAKIADLDPKVGLIVFFPRIYQTSSLTYSLQKLESPVQLSADARNSYVKELQDAFAYYWPDFYMKFIPYGSLVSGLGFPKSYLNICIELDEPEFERMIEIPNAFETDTHQPYCVSTSSQLFARRNYEKITYEPDIDSVKFRVDNWNIEYNFNKEIFTYSTNLINHYMILDPRVQTFLFAIKTFGRGRNIFANQVTTGIRYYGYTILALAYLSQLDPPVIPNLQHINPHGTDDICAYPGCSSKLKFWDTIYFQNQKVGIAARYHDCVIYDPNAPKTEYYPQPNTVTGKSHWHSKNTASTGELLLDFFHYYGYRFDYQTHAISLKFNGKTAKSSDWKDNDIAIEDPFMAYTNLADRVMDGNKFIDVFIGAFSKLYSGTSFETLYKKVADLTKYNTPRGILNDRPCYNELPSWERIIASKSFILIGLPKAEDDSCFCDRIERLFSTHGTINRMLDLDNETKQVFFTSDTGNAASIVLPSSFLLNGKKVHLVELHNFDI